MKFPAIDRWMPSVCAKIKCWVHLRHFQWRVLVLQELLLWGGEAWRAHMAYQLGDFWVQHEYGQVIRGDELVYRQMMEESGRWDILWVSEEKLEIWSSEVLRRNWKNLRMCSWCPVRGCGLTWFQQLGSCRSGESPGFSGLEGFQSMLGLWFATDEKTKAQRGEVTRPEHQLGMGLDSDLDLSSDRGQLVTTKRACLLWDCEVRGGNPFALFLFY